MKLACLALAPLSNKPSYETGRVPVVATPAVVHSQLWVSVSCTASLAHTVYQWVLSASPTHAVHHPATGSLSQLPASPGSPFRELWPRGPWPCHGFSPPTWLPDSLLPVWLVWLTISLIPWLSEFHAVWFSGISGCLLFLDWFLSSFWLCQEAKGLYHRWQTQGPHAESNPTLFYLVQHLVSTWQQCQALA